MVSKEEITEMAAMMRITISDHSEHIDKVQKMLDYFATLDSAGVDDENILACEMTLDELRADQHNTHGINVGGHIRAPGLG